jgi:adenosylmethionine-8-amino-7-oxononanoate aminotransferase|tara:strand:- start:2755 stop:4071 length:1317 start_codon:yes stop_codon:yes gene_type:complete
MSNTQWNFLKGRSFSIAKAEGACLYTSEGQEIIDVAGGAIVCNVGHGRRQVADAVWRATLDYSYVVPPWLTPSRESLIESLRKDWLPESFTRAHFTSGGSESNEAAIKLALHYQQAIGQFQRTKIIGRSISYHGTTLATASISGHPKRKKGLESALPKFCEVASPYPLRCPLGRFHENTGSYYANLLQEEIETQGPENVAAFLAEPITGTSGGAIVPPEDYWPKVREICDRYGVILVMDEVMTGFGRTGSKFGYQHWPIEPDILVGGKGLAGGYAPLGGVFATEKIGSAIESAGFQVMFNTFGAHPAACAAATEVLNIMQEENLVESAKVKGEYLLERLNDSLSQHPNLGEVRGKGLLAAVELVKERETLEHFPEELSITDKIVSRGLKKGVFFYGGGTGNVRDLVCFGPTFTITESQLDQVVDTFIDCVNDVIGNIE